MRFVKPLDEELLHQICKTYTDLITVEDGVVAGGFGSAIAEFKAVHGYENRLNIIGIPDEFPEHGSVEQLQEEAGVSVSALRKLLQSKL